MKENDNILELDELYENFTRLEIRQILKDGEFELFQNNTRQIK